MDTGGLNLPAVSLEDLVKEAKEQIKKDTDGKTV
jgi:hypothetical protein